MVEVNIFGANGVVGNLPNNRLDPGSMRPFIHTNGKTYVSIYKGGDPNKPENYSTVPLNTNGTLRRDEWKMLDDALVRVARQRLGGVQDLIDNGLTYNLGNAMGTTVMEWHDVSDPGEAVLTMDGVTRGNNDRPKFQTNYLPIPITHVDYEINARELDASRRLGNPLDTIMVESAARRIQEKIETMLFTDTTYSFGEKDDRLRNTIYSYVNFPDRNLVNLSIPWDQSGATAAGILQDVLEMKQAAINNYQYGDFMLYIPTAYETVLDDDYAADTPGTTIRERILKIAGIKGIKVIDTLAANNVLLVKMATDTVRLINGMGLTNIEWDVEGRFITKYKVLAIQVPQIRSDQNGKCGIVHLSA